MKKRKLVFLLPLVTFLTGCDINITSDDFTSKLIPNWVSFVTQLGALIVLIVIVFVFAYKPVKKIVRARQDYIESNIKEAEESKAKWKENEEQSKANVLASTRTAADIVAEAKLDAEKEKAKIIESTSLEVERMKKDAENDIARMRVDAEEEIRKEMISVALDASKELLGREVNSSDNTRLLEEFIEDIKKED